MIQQINTYTAYTKPTSISESKFRQTQNVPTEPTFSGYISDYLLHPTLSYKILPQLKTNELKEAYTELYRTTNSQGKADLKFLLENGKLLSNSSDNKTTTLHNLLRIIKEPRANGLDSKDILNSTLRALANPYVINQNFGNINDKVAENISRDPKYANLVKSVGLNNKHPQLPAEFNVEYSGACVSASMEFNLADKRPAEFARYAADLTSPNMYVVEDLNLSDLSDNLLESLQWLDKFNISYDTRDFITAKAVLRPDQDAIYRAISQTQSKTPGTRSALDTIMQSTFMQLGSQKTYNSLTDIRTGDLNQSNKGLTEFEKRVAEALIDDNGGKTSITYQQVDDNAYLKGYNQDNQETLFDIINSLKTGSNVIVGITEADETGKINGGHEITIVGTKLSQDGKLYFICNDTDDNKDEPIEIDTNELIPKIHHAGIANSVMKAKQASQQKEIFIQTPANKNVSTSQPNSTVNIWDQFEKKANGNMLNLVA